jgi:hypothetical protein
MGLLPTRVYHVVYIALPNLCLSLKDDITKIEETGLQNYSHFKNRSRRTNSLQQGPPGGDTNKNTSPFANSTFHYCVFEEHYPGPYPEINPEHIPQPHLCEIHFNNYVHNTVKLE